MDAYFSCGNNHNEFRKAGITQLLNALALLISNPNLYEADLSFIMSLSQKIKQRAIANSNELKLKENKWIDKIKTDYSEVKKSNYLNKKIEETLNKYKDIIDKLKKDNLQLLQKNNNLILNRKNLNNNVKINEKVKKGNNIISSKTKETNIKNDENEEIKSIKKNIMI